MQEFCKKKYQVVSVKYQDLFSESEFTEFCNYQNTALSILFILEFWKFWFRKMC